MKTMIMLLFVVCSTLAQSGGRIGSPSETELNHRLKQQWAAVAVLRPEELPPSTPPEAALRTIEAADAARDLYLRTKQALLRTQSAKFRAFADKLAEGTGYVATPDNLPLIEDLHTRIEAISKKMEELASRLDAESLAESGELRMERDKLREVLTAITRTSENVDEKMKLVDAQRQSAILKLVEIAGYWDALADSAEAEGRLWHRHYEKMHRRVACKGDSECDEKP